MGWVTGHSYLLYGPLACGATTLMFEGVPNWYDACPYGPVVDKHQVNILYTAPTAIRALMAEGDKAIEGTDRLSLRILGSCRRANQPGSVGVVLEEDRQREMPSGRYRGRPKLAVS